MRIISALNKSSSIKIFRTKNSKTPKNQKNNEIPATSYGVDAAESSKQKQSATVHQSSKHGQQHLPNNTNPMRRENEMKIQMLSKPMYEQIFKNGITKDHDKNVIQGYINS